MPSIQDVFNQLTQANTKLSQIHTDLTNVETAVGNVDASVGQTNQTLGQVLTAVTNGFASVGQAVADLAQAQVVTNRLLFHVVRQNETVICNIEKVAAQTCASQNEAHIQTGLQVSLEGSGRALVELYKTEHPAAALALTREDEARRKLAECCPPEPPPPVCRYEPCEKAAPVDRKEFLDQKDPDYSSKDERAKA
jgi:hypothetical protein